MDSRFFVNNTKMTRQALRREAVEARLDEIELLHAMYPSEKEFIMDESTAATVSMLRKWCEDEAAAAPAAPSSLSFTIMLEVRDSSTSRSLPLHIEVPLTPEETACRLRVGRPDWLTKAEASELAQGIPEDDTLSAIEYVRERAADHLHPTLQNSEPTQMASLGPIARTWFYFPSISTREKRNDLVKYAPSYGLTGFLLAGKPGILCLEGRSQDVDEYIGFIKSVSWSDIPSQHKKVSERYRETGDSIQRVFHGMEEITDQLEKRGERSNRGDMKALEAWLSEKGLADAFTQVLL